MVYSFRKNKIDTFCEYKIKLKCCCSSFSNSFLLLNPLFSILQQIKHLQENASIWIITHQSSNVFAKKIFVSILSYQMKSLDSFHLIRIRDPTKTLQSLDIVLQRGSITSSFETTFHTFPNTPNQNLHIPLLL